MADVLRLANIDQSTTIDLLDGTYKLRDRSWPTGSASLVNDYAPVPYGAHTSFQNFITQVETMDLVARDTSVNIRAAQRDIYAVLEGARQYGRKPLWTRPQATALHIPESWWLEWNVDGEPAKRSLIYEGSQALLTENCAGPFLSSGASLMRLALIRHPFWESVSSTNLAIQEGINCWGGR